MFDLDGHESKRKNLQKANRVAKAAQRSESDVFIEAETVPTHRNQEGDLVKM